MLTFAGSALEGQQMACSVLLHAISHRHVHPFAPAGLAHAQAHSVQKQIGPLIVQLRRMEPPNCFSGFPFDFKIRYNVTVEAKELQRRGAQFADTGRTGWDDSISVESLVV